MIPKCFWSKETKSQLPSNPQSILGTICSTFHWVPTAICTVVVPLIVLSLHQLCQKGSCKLAVPQLSRKWADYWHPQVKKINNKSKQIKVNKPNLA